MDSVDRRALLTGCLAAATSALAGCPSEDSGLESNDGSSPEGTPEEQEYDADTPFSILLVNDGEDSRSVDVEIDRNGDRIFGETVAIGPEGRTTVAEYETTGRYTIRAATGDHRMESSAEIERENLMTHRAASGRIAVDENGVLVRVEFDD